MMNNPWDAIDPPKKDVSARRVAHSHPLDLYWARDHLGKYLFVYEFGVEPPEKQSIPELVGISTIIVPADSLGRYRLVLILLERNDWELFYSLCSDLIQTTASVKDARLGLLTILRRLFRWQDFLKKASSKILSEERIKGLIGELLFIRDYLTPVFGVGQAVIFWQGPEGLPQDFNVNNCAVEVKSQVGATLPSVEINSSDQLSPQLPEMYLMVFTLGKTTPENTDALNLPGLVHGIRELILNQAEQQIERFNTLLLAIGYAESDKYLDFSYLVVDEMMYEVKEGFPRITTEQLSPGITRLSYSISLLDCAPFASSPEWMEVPS